MKKMKSLMFQLFTGRIWFNEQHYGERSTSMSKYESLWKWIRDNGTDNFKLTYAEIEEIAGVPIDHSFLKFKKELLEYGFCVGKISMKEETVMFQRVK